jgi:PAS domain S-box-containing protein
VETVTGYSAAEVARMHPLDFVPPEDRSRVGGDMQTTFQNGSNLTEVELLTKKGTRIPFLFSALRIMRDGAPYLLGLGIDISDRKRAEEEVRRLNAALEERVRQRTAQLEAANKELEAFSYSVSHDLRAPLRAIDGFAQKLVREFGAQLPEEAARQLRRVRENARQMGQLIDDLLTFSRLGRQPLRKQTVGPADLVRQVLEELRPEREGRRVEIRAGSLPPCQGDPALLKQVFTNLLGNALKYSRKRDPAVIDVGAREGDRPGECVYFVRDNGAGFDMRYAGKLFGVFQRLHPVEDYEGTGVGLAIVQRIIHRHGGRIWAEGQVDRGAEFAFTLTGEEPRD